LAAFWLTADVREEGRLGSGGAADESVGDAAVVPDAIEDDIDGTAKESRR
jgi:hypothetical protein